MGRHVDAAQHGTVHGMFRLWMDFAVLVASKAVASLVELVEVAISWSRGARGRTRDWKGLHTAAFAESNAKQRHDAATGSKRNSHRCRRGPALRDRGDSREGRLRSSGSAWPGR